MNPPTSIWTQRSLVPTWRQLTSMLLLTMLFVLSQTPAALHAEAPPGDLQEMCYAVADERDLVGGGEDSQDTLVRLNKLTGATEIIGETQTLKVEAIAFGPEEVLYAADSKTFGTIDLDTGLFTEIAQFGTGQGANGQQKFNDVDGLTYDVKSGVMYATNRRRSKSDLLFMIRLTPDPAQDGLFIPNSFEHPQNPGARVDYIEIEPQAGLDDIDDIAIDPVTGQLYGAINLDGQNGILLKINSQDGSTEQIGNFIDANSGEIVDDIEGIAFFNDGQLYGSTGDNGPDDLDSNKLFQIDKETGISHEIGSFPTNTKDIEGLGCLTAPAFVVLEKATNGPGQMPQDADEPTGPAIVVNDMVTWTYVVQNTGSVGLNNIVLVDDNGTPGNTADDFTITSSSCPALQPILLPGESVSCSATGVATLGQYNNIGTVTADPVNGLDPVSDDDPSHYFGITAAIDLEKATNGEDADNAPGPFILVSNPVNWTYDVTNTGNVTLTNVSLIDDQGVTVSCPGITLAPGESMICTGNGVAVAGQYRNLGTVTGQPVDSTNTPIGTPVSDTDPSHYFGATPAIDLEKATNGEDADDAPGPFVAISNPVNWTYQVVNTGNLTLVNITVTDDQGVAVSCPQSILAPGGGMTCTGNGTAIEGQYRNLGTVIGQPIDDMGTPIGTPVSDTDPSHYFGVSAAIDLEKATNGEDADNAPGPYVPVSNPVNWTYQVANTGNLTLVNVTVTDDQGVAVNCPQTTLAPGEAMTCTGSGTAAEGQYRNLGTVTGQPVDATNTPMGTPVSDTDPSHYFGVSAAIDLEKATNGEDADDAPGPQVLEGGDVTWTYVVHNIGNIELTNIVLTDDKLGDITAQCPQTQLAVNEQMTCIATGVAIGDQYENIAIVTGTTPSGLVTPAISVTDTDLSHYHGIALASVGDKVFGEGITEAPTGLQAENAPGIANVTVTLYLSGTVTPIATTHTDQNGKYLFDNLVPGDYYIGFEFDPDQEIFIPDAGSPPPIPTWVPVNQGDDDAVDSDAVPVSNSSNIAHTETFTLGAGDHVTIWDAGLVGLPNPPRTSVIGDRVWNDRDRDGVQDDGEEGVPNAPVQLYKVDTTDQVTGVGGTLIDETMTDDDGLYRFIGLEAGNYYVVFQLPLGYLGFAPQNAGGDDERDSDPDSAGHTVVFSLGVNEEDLSWDAGLLQAGIGDRVWDDTPGLLDEDPNGIQDVGEPGVAGVTVTAFEATTQQFMGQAVTDENGNYFIPLAKNGEYYLTVTLPEETAFTGFTAADQGTDDSIDSDFTAVVTGQGGPLFGQAQTFTFQIQDDLTRDVGLVRIPDALGPAPEPAPQVQMVVYLPVVTR